MNMDALAFDPNNLAAYEAPDEQVQDQTLPNPPEEIHLDVPESEHIEPQNNKPAFETVSVPVKKKLTPEEQATALLENWKTIHPGTILTGQQKRNLYRQFLQNAKRGRYKNIFNQ